MLSFLLKKFNSETRLFFLIKGGLELGFKVFHYLEVKAQHLGRPGCKGARVRELISEEDGAERFRFRMIEIMPSGSVPPHKHDYEHGVFMLEGECIVICEGKRETIKAGSVVFIPANTLHSWHNPTDKPALLLSADA